MLRSCTTLLGALVLVGALSAHDSWVQTNTNLVRVGDAVHLDLMLGNHGNNHRDFKLASKVNFDAITAFEVIGPDGKAVSLKDKLIDLGYEPKEGFWTVKYPTTQPGLHLAYQTLDTVIAKGQGFRVHHSAKTYFVATPSLDKVSRTNPGFDKVLGHKMEIVSESNPVTPMGPGTPIKIRLYFQGKPLAAAKVSFIPRGVKLAEGIDDKFERLTDKDGRASFTPTFGNYYLIAAHQRMPEEKGNGYDSTHYSATLVVYVPDKCPCCEE
ncbi:MAG: DUF4198 domain-containing protein [Planctomycetia bacterium]|nr:DUF4198 domain-containing protein [Planctomycetia bacterium]